MFPKNIKFRVCLGTYEFCEASWSEKNDVWNSLGDFEFSLITAEKQKNKQTGASADCAAHLTTK